MFKALSEYIERRTINRHIGTLHDLYEHKDFWCATSRLWLGGGSAEGAKALSRYGYVNIKREAGYVMIGKPHDMCKITEKGIEYVEIENETIKRLFEMEKAKS